MGIICFTILVLFTTYCVYFLLKRVGLSYFVCHEIKDEKLILSRDVMESLLNEIKSSLKVIVGSKLENGFLKILYELAIWGFISAMMQKIGKFWLLILIVNGILLVPGFALYIKGKNENVKEEEEEVHEHNGEKINLEYDEDLFED